MDDHTLQQVIDLAVKTAVLKAKKEAILECRPVGSYFLTETEDDPNILFGGEWQKLTGRYVLQCSDDSHKAGTTVEAGLPEISGSVPVLTYKVTPTVTGPFGNCRLDQFSIEGNGNVPTYGMILDFSAMKGNSIYGKSTTVQPPARIVNVWKRVS